MIKVQKTEEWTVKGLEKPVPHVDVRGPGIFFSKTDPYPHWQAPAEVNEAIHSEWERVRPLEDDEVRWVDALHETHVSRVRWVAGRVEYEFEGVWKRPWVEPWVKETVALPWMPERFANKRVRVTVEVVK